MKKLIPIIILLLCSLCFAANEVKIAYEVGNTLYFRVFNATGQVWNTALATPAFQAWDDAQVANYDVALAGTGGSFYTGTFPTLDDGIYSVVGYLRAGGAPAVDDGVLSAGLMIWIGGAEFTLYDLKTLNAILMPSTRAGEVQR